MNTEQDATPGSRNLARNEARRGRLDFILADLGLPRGARILDVGCGPGVQFWDHRDRLDFTGIDIDAEALEKARVNGYKQVVRHDVSIGLPFADGDFDVVVLSDILEHLVDPLALLEEAGRVAGTEGRIVVSVPNHFFLANRLRIMMGKGLILPWANHQLYEDWDYIHLRFFRKASLLGLVNAAALEIDADYSDRFTAPFPETLAWKVFGIVPRLFRKLSFRRRIDLWTLHFLVVCSRRSAPRREASGGGDTTTTG